jgi:hypothetical protein
VGPTHGTTPRAIAFLAMDLFELAFASFRLEQCAVHFMVGTLNNVDIVQYRFPSVASKSKNVAALGNNSGFFPCEQQLAIVGDLVWAFLGSEQGIGVD